MSLAMSRCTSLQPVLGSAGGWTDGQLLAQGSRGSRDKRGRCSCLRLKEHSLMLRERSQPARRWWGSGVRDSCVINRVCAMGSQPSRSARTDAVEMGHWER